MLPHSTWDIFMSLLYISPHPPREEPRPCCFEFFQKRVRRSRRPDLQAGSPEERAPRREAVGQHGGDPRPHLLHLLTDHLVLVTRVPREAHRLAEVDAVLDGEGDGPEEAEPGEGDGHREGR